jgi:hypothetical protein
MRKSAGEARSDGEKCVDHAVQPQENWPGGRVAAERKRNALRVVYKESLESFYRVFVAAAGRDRLLGIAQPARRNAGAFESSNVNGDGLHPPGGTREFGILGRFRPFWCPRTWRPVPRYQLLVRSVALRER